MAGESPPWRAAPRPLAVFARLLGGRLRSGGRIAVLCLVTLLFPIAPSIGPLFGGVLNSERNFRYDPTTTADDGRSPDPQLCPLSIKSYIRGVAEFAKHFGKSPDRLGAEQIREYQLFLIKEKEIALPTYIQIVSGLRFLYTNTLHRQSASSVCPSQIREKAANHHEPRRVKALLEAPKNLGHRTILSTMYAAGPRISEQRTSRYLTSIAAEM